MKENSKFVNPKYCGCGERMKRNGAAFYCPSVSHAGFTTTRFQRGLLEFGYTEKPKTWGSIQSPTREARTEE